jgi:ADP-ribose pyrophosphatase YjhB (NUDIX family)
MKLEANVFDTWAFRKDADGIRYLLLHTSPEKAERHFNGGRFWQIPSGIVREEETITDAILRDLSRYGLHTLAIWAGEHAYTIYNRRFAAMQIIGVYAADVSGDALNLDPSEHSEYGWFTLEECLERVHYRGLKDGLRSVHEYVTGPGAPARELCLYTAPE